MQNLRERDTEKIYIKRNKKAIFPEIILRHDFVRATRAYSSPDLLLKWVAKEGFNACCNKGWLFFLEALPTRGL